ncbi:MAG: SHOCT domain-containing protein [Actinobacteria bacterium]|nr:SHOCT domain-containing protein [Actinomycetota bacterium]
MGLILIIVVAALAVWLLTQHHDTERAASVKAAPAVAPAETALEQLRKRYARGEITRNEFEERKQALEVH